MTQQQERPSETSPATAVQRCALCGYEPDGDTDSSELFRALGAEPLVVLVCSDRDGCVTRYGR